MEAAHESTIAHTGTRLGLCHIRYSVVSGPLTPSPQSKHLEVRENNQTRNATYVVVFNARLSDFWVPAGCHMLHLLGDYGPKTKTTKPAGRREDSLRVWVGLLSEPTAGRRQFLQQAQHPNKDSWLLSWGSRQALDMVCNAQDS